jgi:Bacterial extracellular solute-binding protein
MAEGPKLTKLGVLFIVAFLAACGYGSYYFFSRPQGGTGAAPPGPAESQGVEGKLEIGIAYGTEKKTWLEFAVREFEKTAEGRQVRINLIPKGSLEGAQAIFREEDKRIHVWSPASSLYKDIFLEEWRLKQGTNPILKEEALALTPMVFVMWKERYDAFVEKYQTVSFATVGQALAEKGGWDAIAQKAEWGVFKYGHTNPSQSNSGVMTLVLMAYDYHKKSRELTLKDILDVQFQTWLQGIERGVAGMSNSTGNMMRDMVLRGPSTFDVLFVYESVVIDYLRPAEGRWGGLQVIYPRLNMWNDNPFYILDVPWSTRSHRQAAERFLAFLMSEPIQKQALSHGFRPGNPNVLIKDVRDSPFVLYQGSGLRIDLGTACEAPRAEVINNLLAGWQRSQGPR